jgi:glutathione S-transferase
MIVFYELAGADGRRFSPNCWRTRMALAHKGLPYQSVPVGFTEIASIGDGTHKTVPVIEDGGRFFGDSWTIANYLEEVYPEKPSLFEGAAARALTLFVQNWVADVVHRGVIDLVLRDIHVQLGERDKTYFRMSRERRFGRTLEDVQDGRESRVETFRKSLEPFRKVLASQPWLSGDAPLYPDYVLFGALQWPRVVSSFPLLSNDDPVAQWFARSLDLFDGLGRRALPSS